MIDRCAGAQWYSTPNFCNGGVSNANTVSIEPTRSLFQIIIYGEFLASSMRAFYKPDLGLPRFDYEFKMDYVKYCIPDQTRDSYEGMTILPIGPYAE